MTDRKDFIIEQGEKLRVKIPENVALYMAQVKDGEGRNLGKADLKALTRRVIAFASFTHQEISIKLVNEIATTPDSRASTSTDEENWLFNPQSDLERKAYAIYDSKYGHIPVRDLTEEQIEEQKQMYFSVLEFLKEEQIRRN